MGRKQREKGWLGCMKGTLEYRGDIVGPTWELVRWEALVKTGRNGRNPLAGRPRPAGTSRSNQAKRGG